MNRQETYDALFVKLCAKGSTTWPETTNRVDYGQAFLHACENGHLTTAQWIVTTRPDTKNRYEGFYILYKTCVNKQFHVAEWLLNEFTNLRIPSIFTILCQDGYQESAEWLHFKLSFTYDFTVLLATYAKAFIGACENGHLHVAKWIKSTWPFYRLLSVEIENHKAFKLANANNHMDVVYWLQSLYLKKN